MKPLELTLYPPVDDFPSWPEYRTWFRDRMAERDAAEAKHLTDAELAAQYWWSERDLTIHGYDAMAYFYLTRECATLHRFATSPHYFEEAA